MARSESGETVRESTSGSQTSKPSRRPKIEPTTPAHHETPLEDLPTYVGDNPLFKPQGPKETDEEFTSRVFSEPDEDTEVTRNPSPEAQEPDTTLVPEENEPITETNSKPKAATLRTLSGGVSTGVSIESSGPKREPTQYERTFAQAERSRNLANERLILDAQKKIEQLMVKKQLKEIIAELDSIHELGARIPSALLDRLLKIWPEELSPYESGEKRPRTRANPVGPARRGPRIMSRPETPLPTPRQPEPDEDFEEKTEEIQEPISKPPPALIMPPLGISQMERPPETISETPILDALPEAPAGSAGPEEWESHSTPPGGKSRAEIYGEPAPTLPAPKKKGFLARLFSPSPEKISDAQAPGMTRADVTGFGETVAQMRQPAATETTPLPAEKPVEPKKGFLARFFGSRVPERISTPQRSPELEARALAYQAEVKTRTAPKPETGFISNFLNTKLGRFGKRLAILGLFLSKSASISPENLNQTEPLSENFRTEQGVDLEADQDTDSDAKNSNETLKKTVSPEKLKIGTVGSDSEHNALVKLVQAQIEHSPQDFGFDGDASELSHWANELAKDTAKAHGITGLGSEWRLTSAAIGELSVLVDVGDGGRPVISYHNAHDGSLLGNDQLSKFFYQHDVGSHDTGGYVTGGHETKNTSKTTSSSETSDVWADAEASIMQEPVDQHQHIIEQLQSLHDTDGSLAQPLSDYEHAFDVWSSTDVPEAETFNALDEAARNLEAAIEQETLENQHQKFAAIFTTLETAGSSSLRGLYESAYKRWQQAKLPTNGHETPESILFLESRLKFAGEMMERLLDVELKNEEFSIRLSQVKNPEKRLSEDLRRDYAVYLTAYHRLLQSEPTDKDFDSLINSVNEKALQVELLMETERALK
jgi:hypothetical protein